MSQVLACPKTEVSGWGRQEVLHEFKINWVGAHGELMGEGLMRCNSLVEVG